MPGPWFLLAMALTLTLTGVPGSRAQPDVAQQEADLSEQQGLEDLLRQAERLLLLREDLQQLRDQDDSVSESQIFQPDWFSKRQHPGKREEEADEGVEGEGEEGGATGPRKRQHPGRRDDVEAWAVDAGQQKRQHPGRRASWLGYAVAKRQHPGRRLVDSKAQRSWEEAGEDGDEDEDGQLLPEKRQHPGKRALGSPCGPRGPCGQASLLLGLLDDLSRGQGAEEKRQHPGRRAAWASEPLEE
ncbi:hypothetical protein FD754_009316 [Muntiacus muntjak]|uniref:Pro-thyrotropin-releasing hormone n=1 Tax=Muntiacus muntjak TaxID=9888 RepID=A0A5N3WTL6_MUNMU|nr:hypothetical protein FD754_009316 [Muntiacus muntjak]